MRFLSIDFLNTFLLTYRVFTDGETVLNALKKVFYDAQPNGNSHDPMNERLNIPGKSEDLAPRRTSGASSVSGEYAYLKLINARIYTVYAIHFHFTFRLLF